jgi:ATP-dependent RNA helicase DDX27
LKKGVSASQPKEGQEETNENETDDASGSTEDASDEESSDDESSDEDEVDDLQKATGMQGDMLKDRHRKQKKPLAPDSTDDVVNDSDVDEDEGNDSVSEDEEDEEDRIEAAKAAEYFDNNESEPTQDVEVFAQLNLSRPLLRGVASIGFVSPTPIQSRVIPIALSGRDVCARYVD